MANKIYLDANVVLDFLVPDRVKHEEAVRFVELLSEGGNEVVISEDILTTVFYIAKDKKRVLEFFLAVRHRWNIIPFGEEVVVSGLEMAYRNGLDLEDTLRCLCARKEECIVVTEDKHFVDCGVAVLGYGDVLQKLDK